MSPPSKAQWEKIKRDLTIPWGRACFKCDDYLLIAKVTQIKMKLVIVVYVNGVLKGKWMWSGGESELDQMPDIARRFYRLKCAVHRSMVTHTIRRRYWTDAYFGGAGQFIAHLKKHNPSIEVLDDETYQRMLAEVENHA